MSTVMKFKFCRLIITNEQKLMTDVILQRALVSTWLHAKPWQSLKVCLPIENSLLHIVYKIRTVQLFEVFIITHYDFKMASKELLECKIEAIHSVFYYNLAGWIFCVLLAVNVFSGSYFTIS